jgi:hypothetical protein
MADISIITVLPLIKVVLVNPLVIPFVVSKIKMSHNKPIIDTFYFSINNKIANDF